MLNKILMGLSVFIGILIVLIIVLVMIHTRGQILYLDKSW